MTFLQINQGGLGRPRPSAQCTRNILTDTAGNTSAGNDGDLCCAASGSNWVIWGALSGADGHNSSTPGAAGGTGTNTGKDVYCADSAGFLGEVDLDGPGSGLSPALTSDCTT